MLRGDCWAAVYLPTYRSGQAGHTTEAKRVSTDARTSVLRRWSCAQHIGDGLSDKTTESQQMGCGDGQS